MIQIIDIKDTITLDDYAAFGHLTHAVHDLRLHADGAARELEGRRVWMVNSTAQGGGVAEMLPKLVSMMRELGIDTRWVVVGVEEERFFNLTKRIHNLIHGEGDPNIGADERHLYESVSRKFADELEPHLKPGDILIVHDPQPLGTGAILKRRLDIEAIWRCHIGLDRQTPETQAAWNFLKPWTLEYDKVVFSVQDYVPAFLLDRSVIIPPAIDPLSHKNRSLPVHKISGILSNGLITDRDHLTVTPPFPTPVQRLQPDGTFGPANKPEEIDILFRPIVTQVSRWDRLKGFAPLLKGFARLKEERNGRFRSDSEEHRRRLELVRLVLAGPDPASVQDDPEGMEVFEELCQLWLDLTPELQREIAILVLPMEDRRINALLVNALQQCSTIVVQNSLREGFGLTVTEAMWKGIPVLGSKAVGIREQVRDGIDGRLVSDPEDPDEIASTLNEMLADPVQRAAWGRNAQRRVADRFLIFSQLDRWIQMLAPRAVPTMKLVEKNDSSITRKGVQG